MDERKVLIYAHDGVGLGHISRMANLAILINNGNTINHITFISGYHSLNHFLPQEIDYIKLPYYDRIKAKQELEYQNQKQTIFNMRKCLLRALFNNTSFDYIIIDTFIFGAKEELYEILMILKQEYTQTKIILTLRGVLFSKEKTIEFYKEKEGINFINNIFYKIVCFCDSRIIDINKEYFDNQIKIPISYLGYIYSQNKEIQYESENDVIVINFGGGYKSDDALIQTINTLKCIELRNMKVKIILGEYFQSTTIYQVQSELKLHPSFEILYNIPKKEIFKIPASLIIGCGGYNVTVDAIFNHIPLIVIPKTNTQEATIHTHRLENFSSIKILPLEKIKELPHFIYETLTQKSEHELEIFKTSAVEYFFK